MDNIPIICGMITTAIAVGGMVLAVIKWVGVQNRKADKIDALSAKHDKDMEESKAREQADIQEIKDELCVISYAMLASLDGLMQLKCNGNVTKAHEKLEKHLNQQAHGQK